MAIKRKISELSACTDFVGLWTIGVDKFNKSVKVSLEFIADKINSLVNSVNDAITKAETATSSATKAAGVANAAASNADTSRTEVEKVKTATITAKDNAITATTAANKAKDDAVVATKTANDAAASALNIANNAATSAKTDVDKAIADLNTMIGRMTPSAMEIVYPARITDGNVKLQKIQTILSPSGVANNILFIAHNEDVMHIMPDGTIVPRGKGKCKVYVIPTANTSLYKAIEIEITARGVRMAKAQSVRLLANGNIKFN